MIFHLEDEHSNLAVYYMLLLVVGGWGGWGWGMRVVAISPRSEYRPCYTIHHLRGTLNKHLNSSITQHGIARTHSQGRALYAPLHRR